MFKTSILMDWDCIRSLSFHHEFRDQVRRMREAEFEVETLQCSDNELVTTRTDRCLQKASSRICEGIVKVRRAGGFKIQYVVNSDAMAKEVSEMKDEFNGKRREEVVSWNSRSAEMNERVALLEEDNLHIDVVEVSDEHCEERV